MILSDSEVAELSRRAGEQSGYRLEIDLEQKQVRDKSGFSALFEMDDFRRYCLLEGLDDIGLTLRHETEIRAYEARIERFRSTHV